MRWKGVTAALAVGLLGLLVVPVVVVAAVITAVVGVPAAAAGCTTTTGGVTPVVLAAAGRPAWWNSDGHGADRDKDAGIIIGVVRAKQLPDRAAVITLATSLQETKLVNLGVQEPSGSNGLFQQLRAYYPLAISSDPTAATRAFLGPKGAVPGLDPSIPGLLDVPSWAQLPLTVAAQTVQRSAYPDAYAQWEPLATQLVAAAGTSTTPAAPPAGAGNLLNPGGTPTGALGVAVNPPTPVGCVAGPVGLPSNPGSPFKDGVADPAPLPRQNPRTVQEAIAWEQLQQQSGTTGWYRRCLASVGIAYGWHATGINYAIDEYRTLPAQYRHDRDRNPPPGSLLFWTTSGPAGHVAVYVGSGMIASTDMPVTDKIGIVPAEWPEQKWGGTYVGWSPPYFPNGG